MEWYKMIIVIFTGFISGFLNTVAGGGSLLALPVLIFIGLPPSVANGTNRIAILAQNVTGIAGFRSKGIFIFPYNLWLSLSAFTGAVLGAMIAVDISGELFNKILAAVIIIAVVYPLVGKKIRNKGKQEKMSRKYRILGIIIFFFIGIYGGFIQAGVGFLIISALTMVNGLTLVRSNSIKVFVICIYNISALFIFIMEGKIAWIPGLVMAVGNSSGAWIASRLSVKKGDKWIEIFLIVAVVIMAVKLWFF